MQILPESTGSGRMPGGEPQSTDRCRMSHTASEIHGNHQVSKRPRQTHPRRQPPTLPHLKDAGMYLPIGSGTSREVRRMGQISNA